ncbi:MAG: hypothetical protein HS108_05065 [Planctomycetes bacterium]|nr:hypothetical protein [Planctomycetota bacterium]MCL4731155.1 hypothetical protein [Planctomycetota bacterium]
MKKSAKQKPVRKSGKKPAPSAKEAAGMPSRTDNEVHAPAHGAPVVPPAPLPAPSQVLPVRKAGEEAPRPGAGGRTFADEDELEEFDPLFDEVREEKD